MATDTEAQPDVQAGTRIIRCDDCGSDYRTVRPNTRFCAICRLFKDVKFFATKTSKCAICSSKYCRISRNDVLCGICDDVPSQLHGHGDCALCDRSDVRTIRQDVAVCLPCAKDPKRRRTLMAALANKVGSRRELPERVVI